jgi:hypothetical protein
VLDIAAPTAISAGGDNVVVKGNTVTTLVDPSVPVPVTQAGIGYSVVSTSPATALKHCGNSVAAYINAAGRKYAAANDGACIVPQDNAAIKVLLAQMVPLVTDPAAAAELAKFAALVP